MTFVFGVEFFWSLTRDFVYIIKHANWHVKMTKIYVKIEKAKKIKEEAKVFPPTHEHKTKDIFQDKKDEKYGELIKEVIW